MRLAYLGTPQLAIAPLEALVAAGHEVAVVITREDRRRGRGASTSPSPVALAARELSIPVAHDLDALGAAHVQIGVVVAYGRLIPASVLADLSMVNLHFSLLPRWRGAAPLERAILAGDSQTGVCVMKVEEGLDEGGIYASVRVPLDDEVTIERLRVELSSKGSSLLVDLLEHPLGEPIPQVGDATYATKIAPHERCLLASSDAVDLHRRVRIGRAFTTIRGERIGIEAARMVDANGPVGEMHGAVLNARTGGLEMLVVRPQGKRSMSASEWLRGARLADGVKWG